MSLKAIFFLFLLWRFLGFLAIFLGQRFIPYLGFFPYKDDPLLLEIPSFFKPLANFDGIHYLLIAKNGYQTYEQAFFPFYPLAIRLFSFLGNYFWAGVAVSNLSFLLGLYFFSQFLKTLKLAKEKIISVLLFLLAFPTSFFFGAVYTEGLFFLLASLVFYGLAKNKAFFVLIFGFLAGLTRLVGFFLFIPIIFSIWQKKTKKVSFLLAASPILGLLTYSLYLFATTGDPLFFLTAQPSFGANRSTNIILLPQVFFRYLKIFFTASLNWQYLVAVFEFLIFVLVFFILVVDFFESAKITLKPKLGLVLKNPTLLSLNLFSFANLLLPSLTGTFSSIPRYSLLSVSFFIFLAQKLSGLKQKVILLIFFCLQLILFAFFAQGYFVS